MNINRNKEEHYKKITRDWYQSQDSARRYHFSLSGPASLTNLPSQIIAAREVNRIHRILEGLHPIPIHILDVPCGTGKLFEIYQTMGMKVVGADMSSAMMKLSQKNHTEQHHTDLFRADATQLPFKEGAFDTIVCLRLLHRVPDSVRQCILMEFARLSPKHIILTAGISNPIQSVRLWLRNAFSKIPTVPFPVTREEFQRQTEGANLQIIQSWNILSLVSSEVLFLLRRK